MTNFELTIKAQVSAKNLDSASKKTKQLQEWLERKGWEAPEVRLKGGSGQ